MEEMVFKEHNRSAHAMKLLQTQPPKKTKTTLWTNFLPSKSSIINKKQIILKNISN